MNTLGRNKCSVVCRLLPCHCGRAGPALSLGQPASPSLTVRRPSGEPGPLIQQQHNTLQHWFFPDQMKVRCFFTRENTINVY